MLINNAGITHRSAFRDTDLQVFQRVMGVNFFGSVSYGTKASLGQSHSTQGFDHNGQFPRGIFTSLRAIRLRGRQARASRPV